MVVRKCLKTQRLLCPGRAPACPRPDAECRACTSTDHGSHLHVDVYLPISIYLSACLAVVRPSARPPVCLSVVRPSVRLSVCLSVWSSALSPTSADRMQDIHTSGILIACLLYGSGSNTVIFMAITVCSFESEADNSIGFLLKDVI